MADIDADLQAKLVSLSQGSRADLLDFLGAKPKTEAEISEIVDSLAASVTLRLDRLKRKPS